MVRSLCSSTQAVNWLLTTEESTMNYSPFLVRDRVSGELYSPQVMLERLLRDNADIFIRLKYV